MFYELFYFVSFLVLFFLFAKPRMRPKRFDLDGKHVVVTGGSQGIGYDLSVQAFKRGAHVSIVSRNPLKLEKIRAKLEHLQKKYPNLRSQNILTETLDISKDYAETKRIFEEMAAQSGPVDVLINNAGISKSAEFSEAPIEDFEDMIRVNYMGSVYCTKAVVDSMKDRRTGRIAFVCSQAGQVGVYGYTAYSASKFALRGFVETLQMEVRPYGIFTTISFPPDTDTPGFKQENMYKPDETRVISETSGLHTSKKVAKGILSSIIKGSFNSYFGVTGYLLTCCSNSCGPATTFMGTLFQIGLLPLARLIMVVLQFKFEEIVLRFFKKKTASKRI